MATASLGCSACGGSHAGRVLRSSLNCSAAESGPSVKTLRGSRARRSAAAAAAASCTCSDRHQPPQMGLAAQDFAASLTLESQCNAVQMFFILGNQKKIGAGVKQEFTNEM